MSIAQIIKGYCFHSTHALKALALKEPATHAQAALKIVSAKNQAAHARLETATTLHAVAEMKLEHLKSVSNYLQTHAHGRLASAGHTLRGDHSSRLADKIDRQTGRVESLHELKRLAFKECKNYCIAQEIITDVIPATAWSAGFPDAIKSERAPPRATTGRNDTNSTRHNDPVHEAKTRERDLATLRGASVFGLM